jgi:hypothetical protein
MLVQHLLVLFLIVGMPLWDWYEIPRLKASPDPREKVRYYLPVLPEDRHGLLGLDGGGRAFAWSMYLRFRGCQVRSRGWISRERGPEGHHHRNVDCDPAAGATGSVQ